MKFLFAQIFTVTLLGSSSLKAQEAWLLEMPKKFGSYLLTKSLAGETETVQGIIDKLPALAAKKTIREIELMKWKAPGKNYQEKSRYSGAVSAEDKTQRLIAVQTPEKETSYDFRTYGELGKLWAPTLVKIQGEQYLILLERDESAARDSVSRPNVRTIAFTGASPGKLTWYSSKPLDGKLLTYSGVYPIKSKDRPAPLFYGLRVTCLVNKEGQSSVQVEVNGSDAENIILHHNQVNFAKLSTLSGPLKKEVISKTTPEIQDAGEDGTWTFEIEGD